MNASSVHRGLAGALLGATIAFLLHRSLHSEPDSPSRRPVETAERPGAGPRQPPPGGPIRIEPGRVDEARAIAELQAQVAELEANLASDPRLVRGRQLAGTLGRAANAGWDTDAASNADAALGEWLAGFAMACGVEPFEFAVHPERDALVAAFLEQFGLPLSDSQSDALSELLASEVAGWEALMEARPRLTTLERIAEVFGNAAVYEARLAGILTPEQRSALSHRFAVRFRSRNPRPWADRNNALGSREAPRRQQYGAFDGDGCDSHWQNDFFAKEGAAAEAVTFYAGWYEREMLGLEKPEDLSGAKTVPAAWRSMQARAQADVQKKMLEDTRFSEEEKKMIREWGTLYDPVK